MFIIFLLTTQVFLWAKNDYSKIYPDKIYNFTYRDEENAINEFMHKNYVKILEIVNKSLNATEQFFIIQYIFGNFTNSGKIEVLVCFNKEFFRSEDFFTIRKIGLFIFYEDLEVAL